MSYFWIWIYIALIVGGIGGFFLRALLSASKNHPINADDVMMWISTQNISERERMAYLIVRLVYSAKRTIHKNPIRKKPADKYPVSER